MDTYALYLKKKQQTRFFPIILRLSLSVLISFYIIFLQYVISIYTHMYMYFNNNVMVGR